MILNNFNEPYDDFVIYPFEDEINKFHTAVVPMSDHDYDIVEILSDIVAALEEWENLEERRAELIENYGTKYRSYSTDNFRDGEILSAAVTTLYDDVRRTLDSFDSRDSSGRLVYRFSDIKDKIGYITYELCPEYR